MEYMESKMQDQIEGSISENERLSRLLKTTVVERDEAQEAVSQIYFIVFGEAAEWSNEFGIEKAVECITDAVNALKAHVRESQKAPADEAALAELDKPREHLP